MDFIKILVNGTNQEIKRKYFKLENSQNVGYFDLSNKISQVRMVNLEDGFALKNNQLITSPPILKIRGTIVDVRMDTDSNLILIDSVEVSTSTAYTNVFEPYKNTDYLVYINSYVMDVEQKLRSISKPKHPNQISSQKFMNQKFVGKERFGGLPNPWMPIQNGNTLNLIDIAFDGGSDESATHNLYAMDASHKFYQLNIKLDGSVNSPITGNTIWSELVEINTDLATFYAKGFGSSTYPPMLSAYGGVLILTFYNSNGFTLPIFISLNRNTAPDWLSNFPLASSNIQLNISGWVWPSYVRCSLSPTSSSLNYFWNNISLTNNIGGAGGKIGVANIKLSTPTNIFVTLNAKYDNSKWTYNPVIGYLDLQTGDKTIWNAQPLNQGTWGTINNVFTDSTSYIINSQSPNNQTNGIVLIDYQDSSYRYIQFWKINNLKSLSTLGTIQIPMGLGVLQFAAFNGIMFCLTTNGLYFMRYTDTLDGTIPLLQDRCCETGDCTLSTLLTDQLNLWTDCPASQVCNYTGKNTCPSPAPPGPKPTPTPSPSPSNEGFFSKIWGWIKEHWIISLSTVAVLVLIFILIIFIAVKSKQSSSLSGQFSQNLEVLEQQKLASLLKPSK